MRTDRSRRRILPSLLPALLVLALVLAACGAGERAASGAVVRDSAGITIIENTAPAWPDGRGWRLTAEPLVEIGVVEGAPEDQLFRVVGALRLADGRIVVANAGTHELRFYDAQGQHLRSVGREGDGPGEFRWLGAVHRHAGDSLFAYDGSRRVVSVFDADGEFRRSIQVPVVGENASPATAGVFPDGTILVRTDYAVTFQDIQTHGARRFPTVVYRVGADGIVLDTIGEFPGEEWFVNARDGRHAAMSLPFGKRSAVALGGSHVLFGAKDGYEVEVYSAAGALERRVRRAFTSPAVTPEDIERYTQRQLEAAEDENWRRMQERMFAELPFPATMPAYDRLLADAAGNLWVEEYRRPGDEQPRWTVFDVDGRMLGEVDMPPGFSPTEIGRDHVLGTIRDELDVERVRLYGLTRTAD